MAAGGLWYGMAYRSTTVRDSGGLTPIDSLARCSSRQRSCAFGRLTVSDFKHSPYGPSFLDDWDFALKTARECGQMVYVKEYRTAGRAFYPEAAAAIVEEDVRQWSARTMHPSFMAPPMPKHDPRRDA